jgi:Fe-S-cluster-containing hydrogenase component 2
MQNLICYKFCVLPFCMVSCPAGAISISEKDNNVYADTDKCNRCGICTTMCSTLSFDKNLRQKRTWVREDFAIR